jgi:hypothetical protein
LFPFSLGRKAKAWYNYLAPQFITSEEACIYLFYNKYFPPSKLHAMVAKINNFAQGKEEGIPQDWGDIVPLRGIVQLMV